MTIGTVDVHVVTAAWVTILALGVRPLGVGRLLVYYWRLVRERRNFISRGRFNSIGRWLHFPWY